MTLQQYKLIKLLYNGTLAVEIPYTEDYKVLDLYSFTNDYECKGIITKVKLCKEYIKFQTGTTILTLQLL